MAHKLISPLEGMARPGHATLVEGDAPPPPPVIQGSVASRFPGSDVTPEIIRARFPATKFPERITLVNDNTLNNGVAPNLLVQTWLALEVDRPTMLMPLDNLNQLGISRDPDGTTPLSAYAGALVQYWPSKRPPNLAGFPDAFVSDKHGVCYLSGPGFWWLQHTNMQPNALTKLTYAIVDAADTGTVARLLQKSGCNAATQNLPSSGPNDGFYVRTALAVSRSLCPANLNRTSLVVQNTGRLAGAVAASSIRLAFGNAAQQNAGLILGPGGSLTLSGDQNWRGPITVILDTQSVAIGSVEAVAQEFQ